MSPRDSGTALATVLVIVAVMSMIAIGVVQAARFSIQRTDNQTQMDQTRWFLFGAEAYATSRIERALKQRTDDVANLSEWVGRLWDCSTLVSGPSTPLAKSFFGEPVVWVGPMILAGEVTESVSASFVFHF